MSCSNTRNWFLRVGALLPASIIEFMKIIEVPIESLGDQSLESIASRMRVVDGVSEVVIMEITGQILVYCDRESITLAELVG